MFRLVDVVEIFRCYLRRSIIHPSVSQWHCDTKERKRKKAKCRLRKLIPKEPVRGRIWPLATRQGVVNSDPCMPVHHELSRFFGSFLQRRQVFFPTKISFSSDCAESVLVPPFSPLPSSCSWSYPAIIEHNPRQLLPAASTPASVLFTTTRS
jgi:hypothetical protein